jgi:hypothetical protein
LSFLVLFSEIQYKTYNTINNVQFLILILQIWNSFIKC